MDTVGIVPLPSARFYMPVRCHLQKELRHTASAAFGPEAKVQAVLFERLAISPLCRILYEAAGVNGP